MLVRIGAKECDCWERMRRAGCDTIAYLHRYLVRAHHPHSAAKPSPSRQRRHHVLACLARHCPARRSNFTELEGARRSQSSVANGRRGVACAGGGGEQLAGPIKQALARARRLDAPGPLLQPPNHMPVRACHHSPLAGASRWRAAADHCHAKNAMQQPPCSCAWECSPGARQVRGRVTSRLVKKSRAWGGGTRGRTPLSPLPHLCNTAVSTAAIYPTQTSSLAHSSTILVLSRG